MLTVKEKTIGRMLGYVSAIVAIVLCALASFYSFELSVITFIILSYAVWLVFLALNFFAKPSQGLPFCQSLSAPEAKAYQAYRLYLSKPGASSFFSSLINTLRITGVVLAIVAIWIELYWQAGLCIVYYIVTANVIKKLNPWLKMGAKAEKGNKSARRQLYLVDLVQIKMNAYNDERLE